MYKINLDKRSTIGSSVTSNDSQIASSPTNFFSGGSVTKSKEKRSILDRKSNDISVRSSKRKKKRKHISICTTNCRYDIVRRVARKFNLKEVTDTDNWNLYWTDLSISVERCKEMKRFQRINHFPGMLEICRKDLLARNLNRMLKFFPKEYSFFPKTWCCPADLGEALAYNRKHKHKTFILKPDAGSQGRGILITKTLRDIKPTDRMICQLYISHPFLIDGYKFDLRVYTLITSCDPLRIYVYNEGLVRFATSRYKEPTSYNVNNVFMHLTNYALNKHSRAYSNDYESGSKRKFAWFNQYMRALGHNVDELWRKIDDVIIKTVISALPVLRHSYKSCFPNHDIMPACCELLGMDILVDRHLTPMLLEVNHSPSFHTDTSLDAEVKENLLTDMITMLNLDYLDKRKIIREERKRIQDRLIRNNKDEKDSVQSKNEDSFQVFYRYEIKHRGGYRAVYPNLSKDHIYEKYMKQGAASIFSDTASSSARQVAATALRDEVRAKEESKKVLAASMKKPTSEPPSPRKNLRKNKPRAPYKSLSIEPGKIIETEERERLMLLARRDFLVRSSGLIDQVYSLLKNNRVLRPEDERKNQIENQISMMEASHQKIAPNELNDPIKQNKTENNGSKNSDSVLLNGIAPGIYEESKAFNSTITEIFRMNQLYDVHSNYKDSFEPKNLPLFSQLN